MHPSRGGPRTGAVPPVTCASGVEPGKTEESRYETRAIRSPAAPTSKKKQRCPSWVDIRVREQSLVSACVFSVKGVNVHVTWVRKLRRGGERSQSNSVVLNLSVSPITLNVYMILTFVSLFTHPPTHIYILSISVFFFFFKPAKNWIVLLVLSQKSVTEINVSQIIFTFFFFLAGWIDVSIIVKFILKDSPCYNNCMHRWKKSWKCIHLFTCEKWTGYGGRGISKRWIELLL